MLTSTFTAVNKQASPEGRIGRQGDMFAGGRLVRRRVKPLGYKHRKEVFAKDNGASCINQIFATYPQNVRLKAVE